MSHELTITEALAKITTLKKRMAKKEASVVKFLVRAEDKVDPLAALEGGSTTFISKEMSSVTDMQRQVLSLRTKIASQNMITQVTVGDKTMCVTEWLIWRREIAPLREKLFVDMSRTIDRTRDDRQFARWRTLEEALYEKADKRRTRGEQVAAVVNLDEAAFASAIEELEEVLGDLDGQLSLKNATVTINI
ncbi:MAG: hypothetical protein KOO63_07880 [Bacteroidales bacterium]|nr:hypothetical protein [Candidatus Latescibacterota bacterium]